MHVAAVASLAAEPRRVRPAGGRVSKSQGQGSKAPGQETSGTKMQRYQQYREAKAQQKLVQRWSKQAKLEQQRSRRGVRCDEH